MTIGPCDDCPTMINRFRGRHYCFDCARKRRLEQQKEKNKKRENMDRYNEQRRLRKLKERTEIAALRRDGSNAPPDELLDLARRRIRERERRAARTPGTVKQTLTSWYHDEHGNLCRTLYGE